MNSTVTTDIDRLAAPADDGGILIWPRADALAAIAQSNRRLCQSSEALLLDRPLREWRGEGQPIIMTGHQPEFFHAGVWAKNVVALDLAAKLGGEARFLAVDSDQSDGVEFAWPQVSNGFCHIGAIVLYPRQRDRAYEQLDDAIFDSLNELVEKSAVAGESAASIFFRAMLSGEQVNAADYVDCWTRGVLVVERRVHANSIPHVRVSRFFSFGQSGTAPAAALTAHVLLSGRAWAEAYNAGLADYRLRRGIRGSDRPIPDLDVQAERVECPFWIMNPTEHRTRLFVSEDKDAVVLWAGNQLIGRAAVKELRSDPGIALERVLASWRIRPRALTLMLFARLLASDLFIHGIGGAKYDQITDHIIRRFFGVEPPKYACVSATLSLPLPTFSETHADYRQAVRRLRDIRFNPHRLGATLSSPEALVRREAAIAESSRLRHQTPNDRDARRRAFERIRTANAEIIADRDVLMRDTHRQLTDLGARLVSNRVASSREWFFAMHSIERLCGLREALRIR